MDVRSRLNFRKEWRFLEVQSDPVNVGHSDLFGKARFLLLAVILDRRLLFTEQKEKKRTSGTPLYPSRANWGSLMRVGQTRLGAALDAGGRSGPRWTGDAWLARRRRYSTARRDRAHTLKEAEERAGTLRFTEVE